MLPSVTFEELKRRRVALGLSQAELAALLRVDVMTVSRWERGQHRIPEAVALAVQHLQPKKEGKTKRK
jgi:transcriptional regulator with XRE-family HTH domain